MKANIYWELTTLQMQAKCITFVSCPSPPSKSPQLPPHSPMTRRLRTSCIFKVSPVRSQLLEPFHHATWNSRAGTEERRLFSGQSKVNDVQNERSHNHGREGTYGVVPQAQRKRVLFLWMDWYKRTFFRYDKAWRYSDPLLNFLIRKKA